MSVEGETRRPGERLLGIITLVAFVLRAYHYGDRVPWLDETETRLYAEGPFLAPFARIFAGPPITTPPFYFALMNLLQRLHLTGAHDRLLSVVASTAAVPLVYALGKRIATPAAALVAAALLAISPLSILYAREARPYALLTASVPLFFIGALGVAKEDRPRDRAAFLVGGAMSVWLQYAGVPLVAMGALLTLLARRTRAVFAQCLILALCTLPTLLQAYLQSRGAATVGRHPHNSTPWSADRVRSMIVALGIGDLEAPRAGLIVTLTLSLVGVLVLSRKRPWAAALLVLGAATPIVVMNANAQAGYAFYARYAIHVVPIVCVFVGVATIAAVQSRGPCLRGALGVAVVSLAVALALPVLRRQYRADSSPYDKIGALIDAFAVPGEQVLMIGVEEPAAYYGPMNVASLRPYLRPDVSIVFRSIWERIQLTDQDWIVTWSPPPIDRLLHPLIELPVSTPLGKTEKVILGRAGASYGMLVSAPARLRTPEALPALLRRAQAIQANAYAH